MAKTGLAIIASSTPEELAEIFGKGHPPFEPEGQVQCDLVSCKQCWLAWLNTGLPPIPTKTHREK